jgi:hypothetical protein
MTLETAMNELLARLGALKGAAILVSEEKLSHWPAAAIKAMKLQKLLVKARPAASVVCPGCERECIMPVHTPPAGPRGVASFGVCDKRSDINRVALAAERLKQWRCGSDANFPKFGAG